MLWMEAYLVAKEGNFALKVNNIGKLYSFAHKYATDRNFKGDVDDFYIRNNMTHGQPAATQITGFLKLMQKYDIGIELYESDADFQNWKKLDLDSNNNIIKIPC